MYVKFVESVSLMYIDIVGVPSYLITFAPTK
ncbi:hypothetical protein DEU40_11461 [Chryseobacterium sp. AG844]|nr:hypothetical protein DEU40_11461 [Chryseobacterium sp. AG844]